MKKLLALALATAAIFSSTPVMARGHRGPEVEPRISVENETRARVKVDSTTIADSGDNTVTGNSGAVNVNTDDADADSMTLTVAGTSFTSIDDPCGCPTVRRSCRRQGPVAPQGGIEVENETGARVRVTSYTEANSGLNAVSGNSGSVNVNTDDADADSSTVTIVGTSITLIK